MPDGAPKIPATLLALGMVVALSALTISPNLSCLKQIDWIGKRMIEQRHDGSPRQKLLASASNSQPSKPCHFTGQTSTSGMACVRITEARLRRA